MLSTQEWAQEEYGSLKCSDVRHGRRLVRIASEVAARPAGTVAGACQSSASREGAFRFMENPDVRPDAIRRCLQEATLRRSAKRRRVIVAIDGTSLHITDYTRKKGLGGVGSWRKGARGLQVMTALAVAESGEPIGIVSQETWVRAGRTRRDESKRSQPKRGGENERWLTTLNDCRKAFGDALPDTTPWYQLDRGGDCWQVHTFAEQNGLLLTVRAAHDRRLDERAGKLWDALEHAPIRAKLSIVVSARGPRQRSKRIGARQRKTYLVPARQARRAKVVVRAREVPLAIPTPEGLRVVTLKAVLVREIGRAQDGVEWLLLTTHPIETREDVLAVVDGYKLRWRIEDFHRVWKSGLCRVEDTQLRSRAAIEKWATILASVATRAMRLAQQSRLTPDAPATSEFTPTELEALIALRDSRKPVEEMPTLALAVRWVAELGGYAGPWNGPPGKTTIGRGLHDVLVAARLLDRLQRAKDASKKLR